jgi:limonene-1,2-epoxide hydrolase
MTASIDTNQREAIARRYVAEVFTGSNAERARDYFTADIAWHGGALGTVTGVDTVVPVLGGFIGALSDIQATVQDAIASKIWSPCASS